MSVTSFVAILGVIVGATSIAAMAYQYRRAVYRDIFRVYADKYNSIVEPENYSLWQKALDGDQAHWERLTPVMIAYLNLIWEEHYLAGEGVIPISLWNYWLPEIQTVLGSAFAKEIIRRYKFHFPDDVTYGERQSWTNVCMKRVSTLIGQGRQSPPTPRVLPE